MKGKRKKSAWFAFYAEDFLVGTMSMSMAAKGAYITLLAVQFDKGSIPSNDQQLCRLLGAFPAEWEAVKDEVLCKFEEDEEGNLVNRRMEVEREEREGIRQKRIAAGRDGAEKRWQADGKPNGFANGSAIVLPIASPSPSPSPSPSLEDPTAAAAESSPLRFAGEDQQQRQQFEIPTLAEAMKQVGSVSYPLKAEWVEKWHCDRESIGWVKKGGLPIKSWRADLKTYATNWRNNEAEKRTFK